MNKHDHTGKSKQPKPRRDSEMAGSLTPELDDIRTKAHPFRYVGQDHNGNAPRGQNGD